MKEEILKRLDGLAAALKTTTEALWVILVQQAKIRSLVCVVLYRGDVGTDGWSGGVSQVDVYARVRGLLC